MKVFIEGIEYAPKNGRLTVHGIEYDDVPNWLYNIHSGLVSDWVNAVKGFGGSYCKGFNRELDTMHEKIFEFERFCEEYLGFKYENEKYNFIEIKK